MMLDPLIARLRTSSLSDTESYRRICASAALTRVQWQFAVPGGVSSGCAADMTIDDVQFY